MSRAPEPAGSSTPLVRSIYSSTADARVRSAMMLGALLEGGSYSGPWSTGDHGTSGGPFQIHWTVHPDVVAEARRRNVTPEQLVNDPAFAVKYMLPEYSAAADQVGADVWAGNPELAAERTAYYAERPAKDYYATRGTATVHKLYTESAGTTAGGGVGGAAPTTSSSATSSSSSSSGSSKTGVAHVKIPLPWLPDASFDVPWLRITLGLLGLVLLVVGLKVLFGQAVNDAAGPALAAAAVA